MCQRVWECVHVYVCVCAHAGVERGRGGEERREKIRERIRVSWKTRNSVLRMTSMTFKFELAEGS